jgi:hypothetical protein
MVQCRARGFDPFVVPTPVAIESVDVRDRVAVEGVVTDLAIRPWGGGAHALHVTITDGTGSFAGAFLGRTRIAGVDLGETIILGGTVLLHRGRRLFMNPHLWLTGRAAPLEARPVQRAAAHA